MVDRGINMIGMAVAVAALIIGLVALAEGGQAGTPAAVPAVAPAATQGALPGAAPSPMPAAAAVAPEPAHVAQPAKALDVPNVVRDPADVPPPITRTEPETVQLTLTIHEVVSELADGTTYSFWTFDGTVPGPMLRVMEGDTVELTLVNPPESSMGHNIDLHAVNGPGGGAAVTNVQPGETKTFSFKALNPGLYIYHCAFPPPWMHIAQGMYGGILVEPVGGLPPVDREFYVIQGEWYTSGPFGAQGHQDFDNAKANAELPEYYTFNGNVAALTKIHPLEAEVDETVRIYFGVGGPNIGGNFHVIGEVFDRVFTGSPDTYIANEETWYVPPGSFAAFEFKIDEPGQYLLVDHALFRAGRGALGALIATGPHDPSVYSPEPEDAGSH